MFDAAMDDWRAVNYTDGESVDTLFIPLSPSQPRKNTVQTNGPDKPSA